MNIFPAVILIAIAGFAGCASYDGRGLVPGEASAADIERLMGQPAEKAVQGGETVWFYTRAPEGRDTYAVRLTPEGRLVAIEQRLAKEYFDRILAGRSSKKDVRELLGPPLRMDPDRKGGEVWDYRVMVDMRKFDFFVEFADDGLVRKAYLLHDPEYDVGAGSYG
jgi:hypothetical protein